ncbi:ADP-ribosylglycohydrolase [Beggiatoa alba B18LD]|uniref:ADP-ribosylglycohydrolase n=1 Tax=Beggiatoa alba B18LD TaxID=395493 RepID=I3CK53_9GAMM|nr:ADP-ribosylglycohydrolase family protein [Beggiatoa alba]EIJ43996.1 ADP-ribosylglycohydrolase [Beggiatoa alba B18LD]
MLGAITGDIIGSVYEWNNIKTTDFPLFNQNNKFTDDSVLTIALAETILQQSDYAETMKAYYHRYPKAGFGASFIQWANQTNSQPYNSWGNGAAMRISPVAYYFDSLEEIQKKATTYTNITHNHPEGIKGALATASAIYLARTHHSKTEIKNYITQTFHYDLNRTCDEIRPTYTFDVSCQGSVPQAIIAFLESTDFENAIRLAVSLGGDSDTIACITGSIAEAFYAGVPEPIAQQALNFLDDPLRTTVQQFREKYIHF